MSGTSPDRASGIEANRQPDLTDADVRARIAPGAVRAFLGIMDCWGVADGDARRLLGGVSRARHDAMKRRPDQELDEDRLLRISCLVGIFKALDLLYGEALADRWMTRPNSHRLFGGGTPIAFLTQGGLPAFRTLRRLLDARCAGN